MKHLLSGHHGVHGFAAVPAVQNFAASAVPLETPIGTPGNDSLTGTSGNDSLSGLAGNDTLIGLAGNDTLDGGTGTDRLVGGAGNDVYHLDASSDVVVELAGGGNDTVIYDVPGGFYNLPNNVENITVNSQAYFFAFITGNNGANVMTGGAGTDYFYGLGGNDTMTGLAGDDVYFVQNAGDRIIEAAGGGYDWAEIDLASYVLPANVEGGEIHRAIGTILTGNALDNQLIGFSGGDRLNGGAGDDLLFGREGHDTMTGGAGFDAFEFAASRLDGIGAANSDVITDFTPGVDIIEMNGAAFGLTEGYLDPSTFKVIGAGTVDATDRILYNHTTGQLFYDPDGSGAAARVLLATLTGAPVLTAADFYVYDGE